MDHFILRRAILAGTLATFALAACVEPAHAQYRNVVEGAGQTQLNDIDAPTGEIDTTPGATNVFIAQLRDDYFIDPETANGETLSGFMNTRVFRNANGFLDFFYQLEVTESSAGVTATNLNDFTGFTTASAYDNDTDIDGAGPFVAGGRRPFGSQRADGGLVAFAFNTNPRTDSNENGPGDGTLASATTSSVLAVRTNATAFAVRNATVNAGAAANVQILAPAAIVVPEAGTTALVLPALLLGSVIIRRRRNK